jgi:hypothetical protein
MPQLSDSWQRLIADRRELIVRQRLLVERMKDSPGFASAKLRLADMERSLERLIERSQGRWSP